MLPGDLLLCHSAGSVGSLIRFGENSRYHGWSYAFAVALGRAEIPADDPCWGNHIAVYVGNGQVIEALAHGLELNPISKYRPGQYRLLPLAAVRPEVTDAERRLAVAFAFAQLARHDHYGWLSIASIVLQLSTPAKIDVSWDGAVICSAFGAQCWEHAGVILSTRSSTTTMPADLAAMVDAAPKLSFTAQAA